MQYVLQSPKDFEKKKLKWAMMEILKTLSSLTCNTRNIQNPAPPGKLSKTCFRYFLRRAMGNFGEFVLPSPDKLFVHRQNFTFGTSHISPHPSYMAGTCLRLRMSICPDPVRGARGNGRRNFLNRWSKKFSTVIMTWSRRSYHWTTRVHRWSKKFHPWRWNFLIQWQKFQNCNMSILPSLVK